jgi:gamma-glutamyltranspeptidase / glutathione hydrolase
MRGAVAAGHPLTAEAGARVLEAGGNAVDACVAAGLASWVAESPLTGPGGGGFMLVYRARDRSARLLDFYVAVPGLGLPPGEVAEMVAVEIDFSGDSTQRFLIGPPSCAVPGAALGLEEAHRAYGSLPWRELFQPALELARGGFPLSQEQAYLHLILDLILRHAPEGRAIYGDEARLVAGDLLSFPDLAGTLELLADRGARELYSGELAHALVRHLRGGGGAITERDLAEFRVIRRRAIRAAFHGHDFCSNPPPSHGGVLLVHALRLLERLDLGGPGTADASAMLAEVMREVAHARSARWFERALRRGRLAERLEAQERAALARVKYRLSGPAEPSTPRGTTHISVVDAAGDAAALTVSTGAGSGVVVPGTGIHMNNMLGEFDLPRPPAPGSRLSSMMSPSVVERDGRVRLVVGSAGSLRLRNAVLQVVVNVVGHDLPVAEAVERPRIHLEGPLLHCEGGHDPAELDRLEALGYELVRWRRRNLYFGGVAAVELTADGSLAAAGDPRRGGAGIVVE